MILVVLRRSDKGSEAKLKLRLFGGRNKVNRRSHFCKDNRAKARLKAEGNRASAGREANRAKARLTTQDMSARLRERAILPENRAKRNALCLWFA